MKKLFRTVVLIIGMIFCMTSTVFATTSSASSLQTQLASNLQALGVDDVYIASMIEYLQTITISSSQESELIGYVNQAERVAGGATDLTQLSVQKRLQIQGIAQDAAAVLGLNVRYGQSAGSDSSLNTLTLTKPNGSILLVLTTNNARNVQWSLLRSTISVATQYSVATGGSACTSKSGSSKYGTGKSYCPTYYGGYRKTATNIGNALAIGLGLISVSSVVLIKRRKATLA